LRLSLTEKRTDQGLHRKEGVVAVAVEFMHSNDVRMREQLQMLEFALQLGEKFVSLGNRRMQNFDRYPLPRAGQIEAILIMASNTVPMPPCPNTARIL